MSEKLRNCPFCGNHVEMVNAKTYPNFERSPAYMKCRTCNYHIAAFDDENLINRWNDRPIEDELRAELEKRTAGLHYANAVCMEMKHELARRDEIIARLKAELAELNDKAVFIQFENEDELPADISNDVYSTMFNCSHVDGVRLFPYIEENGQKYFLVMLREDE